MTAIRDEIIPPRRHRLRDQHGHHHAPSLIGTLLRLLAAGHPQRVLGPRREAAHRARRRGAPQARHAPHRPRPPLPARGHHPVRRLPRRLVQAGAAGPLQHPEAEYIVFCGVHFMAEAADILSAPHQTVMLPNMAAGCSMADMADPDDVYACWDELTEAGVADQVMPVTYMNSAASLKAFCGRHGGIVCTSSNAAAVLKWAFERGAEGALLPGPAPRPQHRRQNGHPAGPDDAVELQPPLRLAGRHDAGAAGALEGPALAGTLLRAPALHRRPDRGGAGRSSPASTSSSTRSAATRSCRPPTPTARPSSSPGRSPRRPRARSSWSAPRSTWSAAWRTRTRTRRSSASTRWSAPAPRCTASTRPTSPGPSRSWRRATSSTGHGRRRDGPLRQDRPRPHADRGLGQQNSRAASLAADNSDDGYWVFGSGTSQYVHDSILSSWPLPWPFL